MMMIMMTVMMSEMMPMICHCDEEGSGVGGVTDGVDEKLDEVQ